MRIKRRCLVNIRTILRSALRDPLVLKKLAEKGVNEEDICKALEGVENTLSESNDKKWQELSIKLIKLVVELFRYFLQQ